MSATVRPPSPLPDPAATPPSRVPGPYRQVPARVGRARSAGGARTGVAPALRGFWPGTWKAAVMLVGLLVIRLAEVYPPIARIRPSIIVGSVIAALLAQRVRPAAWKRVAREPAVRWLLVYLAAIVVTIPFALWPGGAFNTLYVLPFVGLMFVTIMLCPPTRETLDRVVRWVVLLGGFYAAYVLSVGRVIFDGLGGDRLSGLGMYDPNDLAVLTVIVLVLALGMLLRERGRWQLIAVVAAVASLVVTLKTGSRGGTVALAVGMLFLLMAQKPGRFFALSTIVIVATPLAWMFGPESFRVRTASFLNIGNDYTFNTDAGRWIIWQRGLGYFLRRPLIGVGPGGYGLREGEYFASQGRTGAWLTAHNTYLQVLVEIGIVGGIALVGMIVAAVRGSVPLWRRPPSTIPKQLYRPEIFAALIAFLAGAVFLSHGYNPLLFFTLALATYSGRVFDAERGFTVPQSRPVRRPTASRAAGRFAFRHPATR